MIAINGRVIAQGSQFSLNDVEVVSATIDIEDVRAHRTKSSRSMQAAAAERYHRVEVDFALSGGKFDQVREEDMVGLSSTRTLEVRYHTPEEEIASVKPKGLLHLSSILIVLRSSFSIAWAQRAGFGITCAVLGRKDILFLSVVALTAVPLQL